MIPVLILAAGKGTRMKSETPKVLHHIGNQPMIFHTIRLCESIFTKIHIMTGYKADEVEKTINDQFTDIHFIRQQNINGTGQAVLEFLDHDKNFNNFAVMMGDDSFLYKAAKIQEMISEHIAGNYMVSMFIVKDDVDRGYRKVILDKDNKFEQLTRQPAKEGYTVTNFYIFNTQFIYNYLTSQKPEEGAELKLTDFMYDDKIKTKINCKIIPPEQWFGVNTPEELLLANKLWIHQQ